MVDRQVSCDFILSGGFPDEFDKFRPKNMDLNTYVRAIIESWLVTRSLEEEKKHN